ncbi:MAG: HEAT repeat domain-containing protein [bacterium]|nr:HEAT repeat domain-containing protein [bacterium]
MDPLEFLKSKFKAEDIPKLVLLSDLSLGIIKALLRSGYYDPTHPSAQAAKSGLYEDFKRLVEGLENLGFIRKETGEKKDILVDGLLAEPVELSAIMPHSMAELFIPRFIDFYERRALLSYTIKKGIARDEFEAFLDLMSQPPVASERTGAEADRLNQELLAHRITNVSVIFAGDVVGADRHLPWRVELSLTRLSKDLKMIPLYRGMDQKFLARAKRQVFEDIIRPVRRPDFIKEILINSDLVAAAAKELKDVNIEAEIVNNIPDNLIVSTAKEFIISLDQIRKRVESDVVQEGAQWREGRMLAIIKLISLRLLRETVPGSDAVLKDFFSRGLVPFDDLPKPVQEKIIVERMVEDFLLGKLPLAERLRTAANGKDYLKSANAFGRILPEVIRQGAYAPVTEVILLLQQQKENAGSGFPERAEVARKIWEAIFTPVVMNTIQEKFEKGGKEVRQEVLKMIGPLGTGAIPLFLQLMKESKDRWVRKSAATAIIQMGDPALAPVLAEIKKKDLEWFVIRNLLGILGELGKMRDAGTVRRFLEFPHARVREEAMSALVRLVKEGSEPALIGAMTDREISVRRKAVALLAQNPSTNPETLARLLDIVRRRGKKEPEEDEGLQIQACMTLGHFTSPGFTGRIEEVLLGAISREKRWLLPGTEQEKSDKVKLAIIEALGKVGSQDCVPVLRDLEKKGEPEIREAAKDSREEVEERINQK